MQSFCLKTMDGGIIITKWSVYFTLLPITSNEIGVTIQRALKLEYPLISYHSIHFDETGYGARDILIEFSDILWYVAFTKEFRDWFRMHMFLPNDREDSSFRKIDDYGDFRYSMLLIPNKQNQLAWIFFAPLLCLTPKAREAKIAYELFWKSNPPYLSKLHPETSLMNLFFPKQTEKYSIYHCIYLFGTDTVTKYS